MKTIYFIPIIFSAQVLDRIYELHSLKFTSLLSRYIVASVPLGGQGVRYEVPLDRAYVAQIPFIPAP